LRSTLKLATDRHEASRGLSATAVPVCDSRAACYST